MSEHLDSELETLRDTTWKLARTSLDEQEMQTYRTLVDVAERLTRLIHPSEALPPPVTSHENGENIVNVSVRFKEEHHGAVLDRSRINGGRGKCMLVDGQWITPSMAANRITHTQVNGWRFWKYRKNDGSLETINELRNVRD